MSTEINEPLIDETEEDATTPLQYRSLSVMAILGMVVAVFSLLTIFGLLFWIIPIAAIALCNRAIKQIRLAPTEYTGVGFAYVGMTIAMVLAIGGQIGHHYIQKYTIPYGYHPVKWDDLQPDPKRPTEIVPETAHNLEPSDKDPDYRVYVRGFITPGRRMVNIKEFILVPKSSDCNFCKQQLKSTEMILVKFPKESGLSVDFTQNEIKIGGKFKINPDEVANPFGGLPYEIDADCLQE